MLQFTENRQTNIGLSLRANDQTIGLRVSSNLKTVLSSVGLQEETQAEAEAGTATGRYMSARRTKQAIDYQIPGAEFSRVNDTNITLTLAGSTSNALLDAVSITAGWAGTLAAERLNSNVVQGVTNDTNINGSISAQNLTFSWAGTLSAIRGGTGQSSYAVGDILYAGTTTAISKLADVNTGSVLVSGGVSTAPAWSANPTVNTITVSDVPYGAGWDGSATVPTQNAVYDKIESLPGLTSIGFSAHKNGSNQTGIASITYTKVTFGTELYDVGSHFASDGWTPPAGKVHITAVVGAGGTITAGSVFAIALYKNGSIFVQQLSASTTDSAGGGFAIDDICNGSDVYEIYVYITTSSGTATVSGNATSTRFTGHWSGS